MWIVAVGFFVWALMNLAVFAWIEWGYTWQQMFGQFGAGWLVPKKEHDWYPDYDKYMFGGEDEDTTSGPGWPD